MDDFVYLMSVYNDIEADNVVGVLELEGIKVKRESPGTMEVMNVYTDSSSPMDIYVPDYSLEAAREIIEVEFVRGDF